MKLKELLKPLPQNVINLVHEHVRESYFGLMMMPTSRQRLLIYSSFHAIKAGWACAYWEQMTKEKYG